MGFLYPYFTNIVFSSREVAVPIESHTEEPQFQKTFDSHTDGEVQTEVGFSWSTCTTESEVVGVLFSTHKQ